MTLRRPSLEEILWQVKNGQMDVEEAKCRLAAYEDIGYAKIDHARPRRTGFPETIFGTGKTAEQIAGIFRLLMRTSPRVLATRIDGKKAEQLLASLPEITYDSVSRLAFWKHPEEPSVLWDGYVAVLCAGTSDLPVAEEAALTAEVFGCRVERVYDVGVAGIHRLFDHLDIVRGAKVSIVVAGMEGALASVVGGLVSHPVVAVPTSIGYGAHFQGLSSLLGMLNACAPGISVVNIDNGFGAGYYAALILSTANNKGDGA